MEIVREEQTQSNFQMLNGETERVAELFKKFELKEMLSGANDQSFAILSINAGAGGTESQDWASILLRMYVRFCEIQKFQVELMDEQKGEEAGIKSATLFIQGEYAYGYLKAEIGVHRLVRISPFDSNKRRHTSFASVFVLPDIEETIEIVIEDKDLKIDTYRAGGAGGQKVNKTDSAVRITHIPTGIVVQCQNERSQHQNKEFAMKLLKAKLYDRKLEEKKKEQQSIEDSKLDISWGSQIRSYILHPYRMIKDHRTDREIHDVDKILNGELMEFISDYLIKFNIKDSPKK